MTFYGQLKTELSKEIKDRDYEKFDKQLKEIGLNKYESKNKALVEKIIRLQKRISKTRTNLLTYLKYKNVLPENNTAERTLRNNVVMRKIFGCSRSVSSAKVMEVNTSVIDTLLQQNQNSSFFDVILPKLQKE